MSGDGPTTAPEPGEQQAPAAPAAGPSSPAGRGSLLEWVGVGLGNASVLTALLVYFGWRRNDTHADGLGIQENVLEQSTQDYILRSVGPVVVLLLAVLALGFLGIALDRRLTPRLLDALRRARASEPADALPRWRRWTRRTPGLLLALLVSSWLILPAGAFIAYALQPELAVLNPVAIAVGALLTARAAQIRHTLTPGADPGQSTLTTRMLIGGLIIVCMFWATDLYAADEGRRLAAELPGSIPSLTEVVLYSPERLHITEIGTRETPLPAEDSAFRFRYTGLRLLTRTGDRYFFISDCWTRERGMIITLQASDTYRFEFVRDTRQDRPRADCRT